ncbi:MAG: UvrD-helicase domain-containing protein, partial [Ottowia sp.]|nr:UvrD-helicase domain-containing protein [Ottowia sp.]
EALAAELVARGMEGAEAREAAPRLRALYGQVLAAGREVQICTFHSWFISLLKAAPLGVMEALGLPSSYELVEDDAAAIAALWRPWLRRVADDAALRADYGALIAALGRANTHSALVGALARRAEFVLADAAGAVEGAVPRFDEYFPQFAGVEKPADWLLLREAGCALLREAAQALGQGTPSLQKQGAVLAEALAAGDWAGVQAALLTQKGEPRKFSDKLAGIATVREVQDEVLRLLAAERQQAGSDYHGRITRLLRSMNDEYKCLKRQRGWVDMSDVELAAHRLLGEEAVSAAVLERLDARVRHLLIDEFQDTNPLQWQALRTWLQSYAGAGGGQQRPSVFIVGDAKQSIYRFRRAEPKVFEEAQAFVQSAFEGAVLSCQHTRRNARAVLAAVNAVMLQAQEVGEFEGYIAHTGQSDEQGEVQTLPPIARPDKEAAGGGDELPPWRDSLETPQQEAEETLLARECAQAARWIAARIAAGVLPQDVMVLARRHAPLDVLHGELRRLGIASEHTEKQTLAAQAAVQDVLALLDALLSPGHDLALAQALKSPLIGWNDEQLM